MDEAVDDSPAEIERLKARDPKAFARLVSRHQRTIMGLGQSMGLRGADLDDAAAEVFVAVFKSLPRFEARASLGTWVYRIAIRTIGRVRNRRGQQEGQAVAQEQLESSQPSPHDAVQASEVNRRLWAAVAELDPRQAMAIELFYRQGWSVEQIATSMECPTGTVKTLLFRGREQLRLALGKDQSV